MQAVQEAEALRREAMGAFAHEIRTPLTSIRMVLELARRQAVGGQMLLDSELTTMLNASVDDLQRLADDLQEASRLERGKVTLSPGPCDLGAAVEAARELLGPNLRLEGPTPVDIEGPWDAPRVVRAIAGFTQSANRVGNGSGAVDFRCTVTPEQVALHFASGTPEGSPREMAADAGFPFFRSRQFVVAAGGSVEWDRRERFVAITVTLPLADTSGG